MIRPQDGSRLPEPGDELPSRELPVSAIDLFRFSAAAGLSHRIHYDSGQAHREGHRDVVVQGPLLGAHLGEIVTAWASRRGGRLTRFTFRNVKAGYVDEHLIAGGHVSRVDKETAAVWCDLWVDRPADGLRLVVGTAEVAFPAIDATHKRIGVLRKSTPTRRRKVVFLGPVVSVPEGSSWWCSLSV